MNNKGVFYALVALRWLFIAAMSVVSGLFLGFAFVMLLFAFGLGDFLSRSLNISWEAALAFTWGVMSVVMCLFASWVANQQVWKPSRPRRVYAESKTTAGAPDEVLFPAALHAVARKNEAFKDLIVEAIVKCASRLDSGEYSVDEGVKISTKAVAGVLTMVWADRKDTALVIKHLDGILDDPQLSWKIAARVAVIK